MTGRDKILQKFAENDELLAELLDDHCGCPSNNDLKDRCGRNCVSCWIMALNDEIE